MDDKEKLEAIEEVIDVFESEGGTKEVTIAFRDLLTAWDEIREIVKRG